MCTLLEQAIWKKCNENGILLSLKSAIDHLASDLGIVCDWLSSFKWIINKIAAIGNKLFNLTVSFKLKRKQM